MNFFFDTSALVKFFHVEVGTDTVTQIIENTTSEVFVSELARLEFISALYRHYRNNTLDEIRLHSATTNFEKQLQSFSVEPVNQIVIDEAGNLLKKYGKVHGLRTLDALHLGTFNLISEHGWCFVTADNTLEEVATLSGCLTLNPVILSDLDLDSWLAAHNV
jgi:predicted nucleic acid-binding protein